MSLRLEDAVVWHEVECGSYEADLRLWEELAGAADGPILELGCGAGRVALHLARRGRDVTGLDSDPDLLARLEERAEGLQVDVVVGDARRFDLEREFDLVLAPMQILQLLGDAGGRSECLSRVRRHLSRDGVAAIAIVESIPPPAAGASPLPDVREIDGWVYSSLPVDAIERDGAISVRRLRQTVSPEGAMRDETAEVHLATLSARALEEEAGRCGLRPAGRRRIPPTDAHVGSTVVVLERSA
jgi:SAM-dependent methyltransferase